MVNATQHLAPNEWWTLQDLHAPLADLVKDAPLHITDVDVHATAACVTSRTTVMDVTADLWSARIICPCAHEHPLIRAWVRWQPLLRMVLLTQLAENALNRAGRWSNRLAHVSRELLDASIVSAQLPDVAAGPDPTWEQQIHEQYRARQVVARTRLRGRWRGGPRWEGPARLVHVHPLSTVRAASADNQLLTKVKLAVAAWPLVYMSSTGRTAVLQAPAVRGVWEDAAAAGDIWEEMPLPADPLPVGTWEVFEHMSPSRSFTNPGPAWLARASGLPSLEQGFADVLRDAATGARATDAVSRPTLLRMLDEGLPVQDAIMATAGVLAA